ncbi:ribonuclease H family protein, partial [Mesorhizobium sp. M4B.F.Ca.ET.214.01.1.1]
RRSSDLGVNPVSAFYHDHLFVPAERAGEALAILRQLAADSGG